MKVHIALEDFDEIGCRMTVFDGATLICQFTSKMPSPLLQVLSDDILDAVHYTQWDRVDYVTRTETALASNERRLYMPSTENQLDSEATIEDVLTLLTHQIQIAFNQGDEK